MTSTLQLELQELRAAAESHGARQVHLEHFTYPPGKYMAVNLTVDFDAMLLQRASHEPPMQLAHQGRVIAVPEVRGLRHHHTCKVLQKIGPARIFYASFVRLLRHTG